MKRFILFFCWLAFAKVNGQANYPVSAIPDSLMTDAQAVVRNSSEVFIQQDERNGSYKKTFVITILSEKGDSYSNLYIGEDDFFELKDFSGEVYDASGKVIKKIAKKDLITTAYSTDLATSAKKTLYQYHAPVHPFTVKYEYEMRFKNGILYYPAFAPIPGYDVSLEQASCTLQIPANQKLRYKAQGTVIQPVKKNPAVEAYTWSLSGLKPIAYERWAPVEELFPIVYLSPDSFCIATACGNMTTWETYGQWCAELLKGRNQLPQKNIDKIHELTQNVDNKLDKVKILYDYLQKTTRYVGIQLGIGGWQPMKAEEVAKTGFGDCKALSNYMKSLLDAVEIPSYYTVISTNKKRLFPDFPSFGQADHVILMVPLASDTVFLECTSQEAPFGYISRLANHDALAVSESKVFFCTLPDYPPRTNEEINRLQISVDSAGVGHLTVHSTFKNEEFEGLYFSLKNADAKETNDILAGLLRIHKPAISGFRKEELLDAPPRLDIRFTVDCEDFATQTGTRMFIPLNPSKTDVKNLLTGSSRKYDIVMDANIFQNDTVIIRIPEGYAIENQPKPVEIESPYGYFKSTIAEKDRQLIYTQSLEIKKGRFPAAEFEEMKKFYSRVESLQSGRIGLKKGG